MSKMTEKEFFEQIALLKEEERQLMKKFRTLKEVYVESQDFKVGDKVTIEGHLKGWVKTIQACSSGLFNLQIFKENKEGECSRLIRNAWYVRREHIVKCE